LAPMVRNHLAGGGLDRLGDEVQGEGAGDSFIFSLFIFFAGSYDELDFTLGVGIDFQLIIIDINFNFASAGLERTTALYSASFMIFLAVFVHYLHADGVFFTNQQGFRHIELDAGGAHITDANFCCSNNIVLSVYDGDCNDPFSIFFSFKDTIIINRGKSGATN
jgi:hypothetical protein